MSQEGNSTTNNYQLFSLSTMLTVLFVCLKVFGKVTWSWWIVFLPLIIPVAFWLVILGIFAIAGIGFWLFTRNPKPKKPRNVKYKVIEGK